MPRKKKSTIEILPAAQADLAPQSPKIKLEAMIERVIRERVDENMALTLYRGRGHSRRVGASNQLGHQSCPNALRSTLQVASAAMSFSHNLSSGARLSSAMVMM